MLAACASNRFEASVTRFHLGAAPAATTVAVVPVNPALAESLAFRADADAVLKELVAIGFRPAPAATADVLAVVSVGSQVAEGLPRSSPVQVGIGGGSGGSGVSIGGGVSFPIGRTRESQRLSAEMVLTLRRRDDNEVLWEGRATSVASGRAPSVNTGLLARALLDGYPGQSGKTVRWVAK